MSSAQKLTRGKNTTQDTKKTQKITLQKQKQKSGSDKNNQKTTNNNLIKKGNG
jgi:hypothetical protein